MLAFVKASTRVISAFELVTDDAPMLCDVSGKVDSFSFRICNNHQLSIKKRHHFFDWKSSFFSDSCYTCRNGSTATQRSFDDDTSAWTTQATSQKRPWTRENMLWDLDQSSSGALIDTNAISEQSWASGVYDSECTHSGGGPRYLPRVCTA